MYFLEFVYNSHMTQEQKFISYFLNSAYMNMHMEDEAVYSEDELADRYRLTLQWLTDEWVHRDLIFKS